MGCGCSYAKPHSFSLSEAKAVGSRLGVDWNSFTPRTLQKGMNVELEHTDVTRGDPIKTAKIALAHLREFPDYYERLAAMERPQRDPPIQKCRKCGCVIEKFEGGWVVVEPGTTADGLSYCPPNPDARRVGSHGPRAPQKRDPARKTRSLPYPHVGDVYDLSWSAEGESDSGPYRYLGIYAPTGTRMFERVQRGRRHPTIYLFPREILYLAPLFSHPKQGFGQGPARPRTRYRRGRA